MWFLQLYSRNKNEIYFENIIHWNLKAKWIGHILRRNCLLKQVNEVKIKGEKEVTRRQGRRRKKLLDDLKDRRGYCHLKEEAVDRNMWRNRFGRGFEPVVRLLVDDICNQPHTPKFTWLISMVQTERQTKIHATKICYFAVDKNTLYLKNNT